MKIKKVIVDKLFGIFHHDITINEKSGITIIIGENGLGKTVILEMIEAFFNKNYNYLESVEFGTIRFEFDNNIVWIINKEDGSLKVNQIDKKYNKNNTYSILNKSKIKKITHIAIEIGREIPYLRRIAPSKWENVKNGQILGPIEVISTFSKMKNYYDAINQISFFSKKSFYNDVNNSFYDQDEQPEWFLNTINDINVTLIRTQRLLLIDHEVDSRPTIDAVEKYSKELSQQIKQKLAKSTELSSNLDRTYPNRLIENIKNRNKKKLSSDKLMILLKKLETKRNLLDKVGLVQTQKYSLDISEMDLSEGIVIDVLYEYVQDSFKKLEIFDEISQKIKLLLDVINSRFKHKILSIDKEIGFNFKSTIKDKNGNYNVIPVNKLSSGEQNELVLFYELIFKVQSNSLILIDEPEISLHITWQNNFISDLKKIIKLNKLDALIATHSPDIIGNDWELSIELKGVE